MPKPHYHVTSTLVTGAITFASVTHTTEATADTIITCTADHKMLVVFNSLDKDCWLTYNGAKFAPLPAGVPCAFDLSPNQRELRSGNIIGVYHMGVAPTSGIIGCTVS